MGYDFSMRQITCFCLIVLCTCSLGAAETSVATQPEIGFLAPLGGQQGTTLKVEIGGSKLENTSAIVFETEGITAQVEKVETVTDETLKEETSIDTRLLAEVQIDATVQPGDHWLRVVTSAGVTNRMLFRVNVDTVVAEVETAHSAPDQAQEIVFSIVMNGTIESVGEVDFYRFDVSQPCELTFEVRPSQAA